MKYDVKVALIGHGHLGKWHADKANSLAHLTHIVEADSSKHQEIKRKFPQCVLLSSIDELPDSIDAVVIAAPTKFHQELVQKALSRKFHVFCEKPLFPNVINFDSGLTEGLVVQVGHSERCHEIWENKEVRSWFQRSEAQIRMTRIAPFKGRAADVDVISDVMMHDLDLMEWLFHSEDKKILSSHGLKTRTEYWDHVEVCFELSNNRRCTLVASRMATDERRQVELVCDLGMLFIDLHHLKVKIARGEVKDAPFVEEFSYQKRDHLFIEQEKFYQSICDDEPIFVDFHEGLEIVHLIDGVRRSLGTNS